MISASHNPFGDNGIKFFAPGGLKLSDEVEAAPRGRARPRAGAPAPPADRRVRPVEPAPTPADGVARYEQAVVDSVAGGRASTGSTS